MNQSNYIFALLFIAFVIYITMRGELSIYMGFFIPATKTLPTNPLTGATVKTTTNPTPTDVQVFGSTPVTGLGWLGISKPYIVPKGTAPM